MHIQYNVKNNYNQNFQVRQRDLNNSNLEANKLENSTQKYSTNKNIIFGMGKIKPNKSRNIFANILNTIVNTLVPETKSKGIKKIDNITSQNIGKTADSNSKLGDKIKKVDSLIEDKDLKRISDNQSLGENITKQSEKQVDIKTKKMYKTLILQKLITLQRSIF